MAIEAVVTRASDKTRFLSLEDYIEFARFFLDVVPERLQAVIVAKNERHYTFWQYPEEAGFNITRPINASLMYQPEDTARFDSDFIRILSNLQDPTFDTPENRACLNRSLYTLQQCIGAALDGLPVGRSNTARKINGDLFERLIRLVLVRVGVDCTSGVVKVPVHVNGETVFEMSYQHDLIIKHGSLVKVIGSVKTSSKDRIDKIFMDKFLFNKLTGKDVPHIAVFLNDVQRSGVHPRYAISATFLPGHFKGYTIKLNPLDGVYYCDIRPSMRIDPLLREHIRTVDHLLFRDLRGLLQRGAVVASVLPSSESLQEE